MTYSRKNFLDDLRLKLLERENISEEAIDNLLSDPSLLFLDITNYQDYAEYIQAVKATDSFDLSFPSVNLPKQMQHVFEIKEKPIINNFGMIDQDMKAIYMPGAGGTPWYKNQTADQKKARKDKRKQAKQARKAQR